MTAEEYNAGYFFYLINQLNCSTSTKRREFLYTQETTVNV